jgi:hypothetical protein
VLPRDKPEVGHEISCRGKSADVSDFGNQRNGNDRCHTAQSLKCNNYRRETPAWKKLSDLCIQFSSSRFSLLKGIDIALQRDLHGPVFKLLVGDPPRVPI